MKCEYKDTAFQEVIFSFSPNFEDVIISTNVRNHDITGKDIQTLRNGSWVNDVIVNALFKLLSLANEDSMSLVDAQRPSFYLSSFFFEKLLHGGSFSYGNVWRWSRNFPNSDVFSLDKLFIPYNISNSHWVFVVIFLSEKKTCYYDSMHLDGTIFTKSSLKFLEMEWKRKRRIGDDFDPKDWSLVNIKNCLIQGNNNDCGILVSLCAYCLTKGVPMNYNQNDAYSKKYRLQAGISLLHGNLENIAL